LNLDTYHSAHLLEVGHKVKAMPLNLSVTSEYAENDDWFEQLSILSKNPIVYYGGYLEKRFFYRNESLFGIGRNARNIHLGLDLWLNEGTSIYSPFDAIVKSYNYNNKVLDYGHTLILEHRLNQEEVFYTLYGHLNNFHTSMEVGLKIKKGQKIAEIGSPGVNGGWPPHLHLQLIKDLGSYHGDYPGVCTFDELEYYKSNCPDPTPLFTKYA